MKVGLFLFFSILPVLPAKADSSCLFRIGRLITHGGASDRSSVPEVPMKSQYNNEAWIYGITWLVDVEERALFRLTIRDGKIYLNGEVLDTRRYGQNNRFIFVTDLEGNMYAAFEEYKRADLPALDKIISQEEPPNDQEEWFLFTHGSFLAGGAVSSAGTLEVHDGKLVAWTTGSSHYSLGNASKKYLIGWFKARGIQAPERLYREEMD